MKCHRRSSRYLGVAALLVMPIPAWPHAFGERYDLPVPLGYFVAGAAVVVALSFVVAAVFMRRVSSERRAVVLLVPLGPVLPALRSVCRAISPLLLCIAIAAGLLGTLNPEMNLAPVFVWIVWWVGLSLVVACAGNIWPALDPWYALFQWADAAARRRSFVNGLELGFNYPARLGAWPAVFLLLLFVWIEVIYPHAAVPSQLAALVLGWSVCTLLGMACFGPGAWRANVDVFALYFATLGRFAPIAVASDGRTLMLRAPGQELISSPAASIAMVGFVTAMLATVLFDGLLSTQALAFIHRALIAAAPGLVDERGYVLGTAGLICVWLLFFGAYLLSCLVTARLVRDRSAVAIARSFAFTLVPIAIAYSVAHYFSYLVVKGLLIVPLVSDPLGRKWDLFGTANFYPDIGMIDARFTWYLAVSSIVAGHVISVWLAHRLALREFGTPRRAVIASIPMTVLMVIYTAISLLVIAEPLVQSVPAAGAY